MRHVLIFTVLLTACGDASIAIAPAPTPDGDAAPLDSGTDAIPPTDAPELDTAPAALEYPPGPYGLQLRNVFPNLKLNGYRGGVGEWVEITMLDYYDPDGTRGVTGIQLDVEAPWCGPSNTLGDWLPKWWSTGYESRGARFISTIYDSTTSRSGGDGWEPTTQATIDQWIKKHHTNFDILADWTKTSLPTTGSVGIPHQYTIDPRTMKIVKIADGIDPGNQPCTTDADCCKVADSPDVCTADHACSPTWKTCLVSKASGPIPPLDAIMKKNGAADFPTGLTP